MLYDEILNKWFSHYLYGVENGIENMPEVTAQSNLDGSWDYYDEWETEDDLGIPCGTGETYIDNHHQKIDVTSSNWRDKLTEGSTSSSAMYSMNVAEDTTIKGTVAVHIKAATTYEGEKTHVKAPASTGRTGSLFSSDSADSVLDPDNFVNQNLLQNNDLRDLGTRSQNERSLGRPDGEADSTSVPDALMMSAMLVDIDESEFGAYNTSGSQVPTNVLVEGGAWMGGDVDNYDLVEFKQSNVKYKIIARGWMDLNKPDAGYDSKSASQRTELEEGKFYDYTLYLQPNLYTVEAGHKLALVIYTYEPGKANYTISTSNTSEGTVSKANVYGITIDNSETFASIPVNEEPGVEYYTVSYAAGAHGSVSADFESRSSFAGGSEVQLSARADSGYKFSGWTVNGLAAGKENPGKFTVEEDSEIIANFVRISTGGSQDIAVIKAAQTEHGTISLSDTSPSNGAVVSIKAVAENGYILDTLKIIDENGKSVPYTKNDKGDYEFMYKGVGVTVKASFTPIEAEDIWENPFTDVKEGDWFYENVRYVQGHNLMTGTSKTTFEPQKELTRAMLVTILWRIEGEPWSQGGSSLKDLTQDWYKDAVNWTVEADIVEGDTKDVFDPDDAVTREQMATLLYRYSEYKQYDSEARGSVSKYTDADTISAWAMEAMQWAMRRDSLPAAAQVNSHRKEQRPEEKERRYSIVLP